MDEFLFLLVRFSVSSNVETPNVIQSIPGGNMKDVGDSGGQNQNRLSTTYRRPLVERVQDKKEKGLARLYIVELWDNTLFEETLVTTVGS